MSKKLVQCFYNCNYNEGCHDGKSKFVWGFGWFDLVSDDSAPLSEQIMKLAKLDKETTFNLNLTSFTPFSNELFEQYGKDNDNNE